MKTLFKVLTVSLLASSMFIVSCKKEKNETPTTSNPAPAPNSTTAKADLKTGGTSIGNEVSEIANTQGAKTMSSLNSFATKDDPFSSTNKMGQGMNLMNKIKKIVSLRSRQSFNKMGTNGNFDFKGNAGTYTWVASAKNWTIALGQPNDKIIINFPSDTTKTTNNAKLTIHNYTEVLITSANSYGTDSSYYPTTLLADLYVDNVKMASVDYTGSFNKDGVPISVKLTLYLKPYTLSTTLNNQGINVSATLTLAKDGKTGYIIDIGGTVEFTDITQEVVKKVNGHVQVLDIKLDGWVNVQALDALDSTATYASINKEFAVDVYYKGTKVGKLEAYQPVSPDVIPMGVRFNDGSIENIMKYVTPIAEAAEKAMKDFQQ